MKRRVNSIRRKQGSTEPSQTGAAHRAGEPFDYMSLRRGIRLTQNTLTAFFLGHLNDRSDALESLGTLDEESDVRVHSKPSL